ncbi:MAG: 2-oxoglutarate dehydrogenase E1 component, partial [Amylibacter sp.]
MTDQSSNDQLHASSFLQGHNAEYIEQLHANYVKDPASVDESWVAFFGELADDNASITKEAEGASWGRDDWPPIPNDDLTAALDGQWAADPETAIKAKATSAGVGLTDDQIQRAVLDSIRALMIIRAHRIRGHLAADLDPLGMKKAEPHPELDPKFYGFNEVDMDRPIFLDNVLGMQTATMRTIIAKLRKTYCGTFALQYMHISDPLQAAWLKERIEDYDKENFFTKMGRKAILAKMVEAEGFEKFCHVKYSGTKRFGL